MTVIPGFRDGDDEGPATEIPPAYHPLFAAVFDIVFLGAPTSTAVDMVKADIGAARDLIRCVEASDGRRMRFGDVVCGGRFAPMLLNVLVPMVARQVARDLVDEIEASEDEK